MFNLNITKEDIEKHHNGGKTRMSTKQALSMQATLENAMNKRQPVNPNNPGSQTQRSDGFGRTSM